MNTTTTASLTRPTSILQEKMKNTCPRLALFSSSLLATSPTPGRAGYSTLLFAGSASPLQRQIVLGGNGSIDGSKAQQGMMKKGAHPRTVVPIRTMASVIQDILDTPPPASAASSTTVPLVHVKDYHQAYAQKLKDRAAKENVSVDELLERARKQQEQKDQCEVSESSHPMDATSSTVIPPQIPTDQQAPPAQTNGLPTSVKPLSSLLKMDKILTQNKEKITQLWHAYHASTNTHISGVMSAPFYEQLHRRGRSYPLFILPLPRPNAGYEFFLMQWHGHQIYFTSLLEWQTHGPLAKPLLVMTHYTDLAEVKDAVLMAGELGDPESGRLSLVEAQNLAYQVQLFYATGGAETQKLVELFHQDPASFDHNKLITALETLGQ